MELEIEEDEGGGGGGVRGEILKTEPVSPMNHGGKRAPIRVTFRDDVMVMDAVKNSPSTTTSGKSSFDDDSLTNDDSSMNGTGPRYSKLRSNLTRDQMDRNPYYFYEVTQVLGSGGMGEVRLVKKRTDKVGGSARRDIQEAIKRQRRERKCLNLPIIGSVFQLCLDGDLKDSRRRGLSFGGFLGSKRNNALEVSASASFDDSSLSNNCSSDSSGRTSSREILYAMKTIRLNRIKMEGCVDELRNEIAIMRDLDHPHIVRAIETFEWKGEISIVMELCSGGDLYDRDPYTEAEAARIINSVLGAVAHMHSRNIIHRDLKFENILFVTTSSRSEVKVIDFGLSKVYGEDKAHLKDAVGTMYTMAPEVIMGDYSEMADMWSIGKYRRASESRTRAK